MFEYVTHDSAEAPASGKSFVRPNTEFTTQRTHLLSQTKILVSAHILIHSGFENYENSAKSYLVAAFFKIKHMLFITYFHRRFEAYH